MTLSSNQLIYSLHGKSGLSATLFSPFGNGYHVLPVVFAVITVAKHINSPREPQTPQYLGVLRNLFGENSAVEGSGPTVSTCLKVH